MPKLENNHYDSCDILECLPFHNESHKVVFVTDSCAEFPILVKTDTYVVKSVTFTNKYFVLPSNIREDFSKLVVVNASKNSLIEIRNDNFLGLSDLKLLYLDANDISKIETEAFKDQKSLEFLYLNDNQLTYLKTATFAVITSLKEIYLHDNPITIIDPEVFNSNTNLEVIMMCGENEGKITGPSHFQCIKKLFNSMSEAKLQEKIDACEKNNLNLKSQCIPIDDKSNTDVKTNVSGMERYFFIYLVTDLAIALMYLISQIIRHT